MCVHHAREAGGGEMLQPRTCASLSVPVGGLPAGGFVVLAFPLGSDECGLT